jgi:hypothetical protein
LGIARSRAGHEPNNTEDRAGNANYPQLRHRISCNFSLEPTNPT